MRELHSIKTVQTKTCFRPQCEFSHVVTPTALISWTSPWRETPVLSWSWLCSGSSSLLGLCHSSPLCCCSSTAVPTLMWWEHPSEPFRTIQPWLQRTTLSLTSGKHATCRVLKNKNSKMEAWLALNDKTQSVLIQIQIKKHTNFSDSCGKSHLCVNFFPFCVSLRGNLQFYYCT